MTKPCGLRLVAQKWSLRAEPCEAWYDWKSYNVDCRVGPSGLLAMTFILVTLLAMTERENPPVSPFIKGGSDRALWLVASGLWLLDEKAREGH